MKQAPNTPAPSKPAALREPPKWTAPFKSSRTAWERGPGRGLLGWLLDAVGDVPPGAELRRGILAAALDVARPWIASYVGNLSKGTGRRECENALGLLERFAAGDPIGPAPFADAAEALRERGEEIERDARVLADALILSSVPRTVLAHFLDVPYGNVPIYGSVTAALEALMDRGGGRGSGVPDDRLGDALRARFPDPPAGFRPPRGADEE